MKKNIIASFTKADGELRAVIATVAFSMGLDSPNIRKIIHWGPPGDLEMYLQQTGRGGRDGEQCVAILYYCPKDLQSEDIVKEEMREYCTNKTECRRKVLMAHFGGVEDFAQPDCKHLCCDVCAQSCKCGDCSAIVPTLHLEDVDIEEIDNFEPPLVTPRSKPLPRAQQDALKKELEAYRYRLCESTDTPGASLMVGLDIATGLSNALINTIVEHAQCFSVTDIDSSKQLVTN